MCATYSSKEHDDSVCPWEDVSLNIPSRSSKESPAAYKDESGCAGSGDLVRTESDPTLSVSTSKGTPASVPSKRPTAPSSGATSALMKAVKDLPGTSGIAARAVLAPCTLENSLGALKMEKESHTGLSTSKRPTPGPLLDPASKMGRASSTESTLDREASGNNNTSTSSHHHHHHHHHHHGASNRRSKNRSKRRTRESAKPDGSTEPSSEEKKPKSHPTRPHHQHSTSSLLTSVAAASVAPASVLAVAPLEPSGGKQAGGISSAAASAAKAMMPNTTLPEAKPVDPSLSKQGTSSKCTQTKMAENEEMLIPTSPTLARQSPMCTGTGSTPSVLTAGNPDLQKNAIPAATKPPEPKPRVTQNVPGTPKPASSPSTAKHCKSSKHSGSSDRGSSDNEHRGGSRPDSDKEDLTKKEAARGEHCAKHCKGEDKHHRHHHKSHHCHESHVEKQKSSEKPSDKGTVTSSEPVEGPGPPPQSAATGISASNVEGGASGSSENQPKQEEAPSSSSAGDNSTCEKKGEAGKWASSTEVCPWEDE